MERNDDNGLWASDDGTTWMLITPSAAFLAQRAAEPEPEPELSPEVIAAQAISNEISSRINDASTLSEVKLAITEGLNAALIQLQGGQL